MQNVGGYSRGIRIRKFLLHETGGYNTQYRRPYDTCVDMNTYNIVVEKLQHTRHYEPSLMGGLANKLVSPAATPEKELLLPNGWVERRMRFMMEIEYNYTTGGGMTEVVLGYTDYNGVGISGSIDPNMLFFVNSIMEVRHTQSIGMMGNQTLTAVTGSSHVLVDNAWQNVYSPMRDQHMRPVDIYAAMSRVQMRDIPQEGIVDARTMANNTAVKSFRSNASAASFVSKIFNGYTKSVVQGPFGDSEGDIIDRARGLTSEDSASEDPFLCAVMQIRGESGVGNTFTYGDLRRIDPNIDNVTIAQLLSPQALATVHRPGQTSDWGGSDIMTSTANILSQTIPGLLMDLALTRVVFKSTNRDINSTARTVILDAQGFSNGDLSRPLAAFVSRIESEVLKDISFNNAIEFAIEMNVDLLGETWLSLSLDGKAPIDFVTPSFCDALMTPVISNDNNRVLNLADDFQRLSEHLVDNVTGSTMKSRENGDLYRNGQVGMYIPGSL